MTSLFSFENVQSLSTDIVVDVINFNLFTVLVGFMNNVAFFSVSEYRLELMTAADAPPATWVQNGSFRNK